MEADGREIRFRRAPHISGRLPPEQGSSIVTTWAAIAWQTSSGYAMVWRPDKQARAESAGQVYRVTEGILRLVAASHGQVHAERQGAGIIPQGRFRPWRGKDQAGPPVGPPGLAKAGTSRASFNSRHGPYLGATAESVSCAMIRENHCTFSYP